jgi:hypothetical protein
VELAGQAGGLVQLVGQPVAPLVAATKCPNSSSAQTYQFVTIPGPLIPAGKSSNLYSYGWDSTMETAYGSVDISSNGSTIDFKNIQQSTLGGTATAAPSSTGTCASTYYGNTIAVPGQAVISNPGVPGNGNSLVSPQAIIGIGSSGFLIEDNGAIPIIPEGSSLSLPYNNVLGSGTGAVGLPRPSSDITGAVVGAQYLGFIYTPGHYPVSGSTTGWSSNLASFGFPAGAAPANCSSLVPSTVTNPIYGGDYANNLQANNTYGICDFAIDLGTPTGNGLYTNAIVYVGTGFPTNTSGTTGCGLTTSYCFSAVAIAGQLNGKHAIFVLGVDSTQPWAVYLLPSN